MVTHDLEDRCQPSVHLPGSSGGRAHHDSATAGLFFSSDGIEWDQRSSALNSYRLAETNFGLVAFPMAPPGPWFAVSTDDGATWQDVEGPLVEVPVFESTPVTDAAGEILYYESSAKWSAGGGAVGDIRYFVVTDGDRRSLWIGRPGG